MTLHVHSLWPVIPTMLVRPLVLHICDLHLLLIREAV